MQEFYIKLSSVQSIQAFVSLSAVQPFRVMIGNDRQEVSAQSFIGMFSLDFSHPLLVSVDCGEEECRQFQQAIKARLADL